jgi:hypothetical protein
LAGKMVAPDRVDDAVLDGLSQRVNIGLGAHWRIDFGQEAARGIDGEKQVLGRRLHKDVPSLVERPDRLNSFAAAQVHEIHR